MQIYNLAAPYPPAVGSPAADAPREAPDTNAIGTDTVRSPLAGESSSGASVPTPEHEPTANADDGGGTDAKPETELPPVALHTVPRAGWFSVSHDDLNTVLSASSGSTGLRNMGVWVHLLRCANRKQSLEFQISCDVVGADLRGVDRRTIRAALEVLRDCGLLSMSEPEKNTATGYFLPTTIRLHPACSPVRNRVQKTDMDNGNPCAKKVHGDSDMVTPAILKRSSSKEDSSRVSSLEKTDKRKRKDYSARGKAQAGKDGPALEAVPTRSASAWNSKKPTADRSPIMPQLKAANHE